MKNLQGDVVQIRSIYGTVVVEYTYDAWGNVLSITGMYADTLGVNNPIRYCGYYQDFETGFYYLQSRYYDPAVRRFINADGYINANDDLLGYNMYAYCGNNPVNRNDDGGMFWDTIFDVVSLVVSVVEVVANPTDPWAWAGLVGDAIDLIPFVSGVGEVTRAVKTMDKVTDTVHIAKAVDFTDEAADIVKTLDRSSGFTKSTASAGRKIHAGYKTGYSEIKGMTKEAVRGKNRIDFLDEVNKVIYELKPCNPRGIKQGINQLQRYNQMLGGGYTLILELY